MSQAPTTHSRTAHNRTIRKIEKAAEVVLHVVDDLRNYFLKEYYMSLNFKPARTDLTTTYTEPDGENFVTYRAELSKAEANRILGASPSGERDISGGLNFFRFFFGETAVGWSMTDHEGSPMACTVANYDLLDAGAARWVDEQSGKHLNLILGASVEEQEKKSNDSPTSQPSAD